MKISALILCGMATMASGVAFAAAGTCADPIPLASLQSVPDGSTCGGEIGINMGGVVYGHPSMVYRFHINQAGPGGTPTTISVTGTDREASITDSCTNAPTAISSAAIGPADVSTLATGDWLLVVSTDPGLTVTDPPRCGAFAVTAGVLPVSLQEFSVN